MVMLAHEFIAKQIANTCESLLAIPAGNAIAFPVHACVQWGTDTYR